MPILGLGTKRSRFFERSQSLLQHEHGSRKRLPKSGGNVTAKIGLFGDSGPKLTVLTASFLNRTVVVTNPSVSKNGQAVRYSLLGALDSHVWMDVDDMVRPML